MTGDLVFCAENDVDGGIVSASSAISTLPASNVKDFDIKKVWRATSNSADLIVDAGSTLTLGLVMAVASNALITDSFQVRASITDPAVVASLTYDSGLLPGIDPVFGKFVHMPSPQISYRYLKLSMTHATSPEVGRLVAGTVWRPSYHMSLVSPPESLSRDFSRWTYSIGRNVFIDALPSQRGYRFTMRGITDVEKESEVDLINRVRGRRKDMFVCIDASSSNLGRDSIWGLLEQPIQSVRMQSVLNSWECETEIWERL